MKNQKNLRDRRSRRWLALALIISISGAWLWIRHGHGSAEPSSPATAADVGDGVAAAPETSVVSRPTDPPEETSSATPDLPPPAVGPAHAAVAPAVSPAPAPTALPEPVVAPARPAGNPANPAPAPPNEVYASARMYAAHSSLRQPEVADPDSKSNKQILQTMLLKALAKPAEPQPANK